MLAKLKNLKADLNAIDRVRDLCAYRKNAIITHSSEKEYEQHLKFLDKIIANLKKEMSNTPKGHRYTGSFYVRKINFDQTVEAIYMEGSAFMREDLISWRIQSDHEYAKN